MILINKTKCPKEMLLPLLRLAAKSIGLKPQAYNKIVAVIKPAKTRGSYGFASFFNTILLRKKWLSVNGKITVWFPAIHRYSWKTCNDKRDFLPEIEYFYKVCQHEFAHIKDHIEKTYREPHRHPSGRRIAWADRPCEMYAERCVKKAKQFPQADDLIINLALWLEGQYNDKRTKIQQRISESI